MPSSDVVLTELFGRTCSLSMKIRRRMDRDDGLVEHVGVELTNLARRVGAPRWLM